MKITFISPNMMHGRSSDSLEPIVFAILKSLTPDDVTCVLVDERIEPVEHQAIETDLVALTVDTYSARRAYEIAAIYRSRKIPVVMGGMHPTTVADEASQHADSIVIGDAEGVWARIVNDARCGQLKPRYEERSPSIQNLMPDRSIFVGKKYPSVALVQFGRGCRYFCDFCSINAFYGTTLRQRSIDLVVEELKTVAGNRIMFTDDNLFVNKKVIRELLTKIAPLGLRWVAQVSLDIAGDDTLLQQMRESGCMAVVIGFESLDQKNLRQMKKPVNTKHGNYEELIANIHAHGIMIYGTFVFGYDADTPDSMESCLEFAQKNRFFLANFNPLTPMPGTALHARLEKEGRFLFRPDWWLDESFRYGDCQFTPAGMSAQELTTGCAAARQTFYSLRGIARRLLNLRTNARNPIQLAAYLGANLISAREIRRKQGTHLGRTRPTSIKIQNAETAT